MKPIETAPKDGTHILLYGELETDTGIVNDFETDRIPIKAFFEGYYFRYTPVSDGCWYHVACYPAIPTHWDHLPKIDQT